MVKTSSSSKLISWVDYSLFHSSDFNWVKGSIAIALCVHAWALRVMVEFVPPSGLLYFLVHCGHFVGTTLSFALLAPPLILETIRGWNEKRISVEACFLFGLVLMFFISLSASLQSQPWFYYEVISTALMVYGGGRHWLTRKKRLIKEALPIHFNRIERCNRVESDGSVVRIPLVDLKVGDEIKVSTSQVIPVDGVVVRGEGYVSEASLKGTTFPIIKQPGDPILAGSVSQDGIFTLKTLAPYLPRKFQFIPNPLLSPEGSEDKLRASSMYASLMLGVLAVIGFVVGAYRSGFYPALVQASGILIAGGALVWVSRIPVHYWTGLVHLTKRKLYGRGPEFVTQMANVDCAFFGKTGVVSRNDLKLERLFVMPAFQDREDWILSLIHQTKRMVNHPLINSLSGVGALIDGEPVMEDLQYNIVPGFGVEVNLTDGLGNRRKLRIGEQLYILGQNGESKFRAILEEHDLTSGKRIWFSLDGRLCAIAKLKEAWNISPQPFFAQMEYLGVPSGILTGDSEFDDARLEGLDLEKNLSSRQKQDRVVTEMESDQRVLFVGDGLNDFRAMSTSYVSVALRHSPDPLLASASAVLASNRLSTIAFSIPYCRRIIRLSKINEWAFLGGTALVSLGLILGWLNPLAALTAQVIASVVIAVQSYFLGSRVLSSVKKRSRRRVSQREILEDVAPYRRR